MFNFECVRKENEAVRKEKFGEERKIAILRNNPANQKRRCFGKLDMRNSCGKNAGVDRKYFYWLRELIGQFLCGGKRVCKVFSSFLVIN